VQITTIIFGLKSKFGMKTSISSSFLYLYALVCFTTSLSIQGPDELAQFRYIFSLTNSLIDSNVYINPTVFLLFIHKIIIGSFAIIFDLIFSYEFSFIENNLITNYLFLPLSGEQITFNNLFFNYHYLAFKIPQFLILIFIIYYSLKKDYKPTLFALCIPSTMPLFLNITTDYFSYVLSIFIIQLISTKFFLIKIIILCFFSIYLDNNFFPLLLFFILYNFLELFKIKISNIKFFIFIFTLIVLIRIHIYADFDNVLSNFFYSFHRSYEESIPKYFRQILVLIMSFWYLDGSMSYMAFGPEYLILICFVYHIFKYGESNTKKLLFSSLTIIIFMLTSVIVFSHSRFYLFLLPILYYGYKITKEKYSIKYEFMYLFPLIGCLYKLLYSSIFLFQTLYIK